MGVTYRKKIYGEQTAFSKEKKELPTISKHVDSVNISDSKQLFEIAYEH